MIGYIDLFRLCYEVCGWLFYARLARASDVTFFLSPLCSASFSFGRRGGRSQFNTCPVVSVNRVYMQFVVLLEESRFSVHVMVNRQWGGFQVMELRVTIVC